MTLTELKKTVVDALEDIKGKDIDVIDTGKLTALFDCIVIATGDSNRQVRALANNVAEKVKEAGGDVRSVEGEDGGEWVLVDLGDIVVHVMQPAIRSYYALEELWSAKPPHRPALKASSRG
jgi:ribosome-associated protein